MARILPNEPTTSATKEEMRVFKALRRLPDEHFVIWQRLHIHSDPGPDFMVVDQAGRALLLKVSRATPDEAQTARQPSLFDSLLGRRATGEPLGKAEFTCLVTFRTHLAEKDRGLAGLPVALLFPNLPQQALKRTRLAHSLVAGQEDIEAGLAAWLAGAFQMRLTPVQLDLLRAAFTPEVIVPGALTTRGALPRPTQLPLADFLLDYDQEWALKLDLELTPETRPHVQAFQLRLINGVAGSGKSLIVLYRAKLLHELFPGKRLLVTTHNKALMRDLEARYHRLGGNGQQTEWKTFQAWCRAQLYDARAWRDPIGYPERQSLIQQVWAEFFRQTAITARRFEEELDWYKDQMLFTREAYLTANRRGRGFQLQLSMRERMYDAFLSYQALLGERVDWADVPRRTYELLVAGTLIPEPYDAILVDEAQFFAPLWFEIIKRVLVPQGHLFMVADPSQGFLKRRQSWVASGLEVRGRSERLERSYRTTREILSFARRFYQMRLPEEDEDVVEPEFLHMPRGTAPEVLVLRSEQDELTHLIEEVRRFREQERSLGHLLVIHPTTGGSRMISNRLRQVFGQAAAGDPRELEGSDYIRVCTLDAVTGLEAPIVFIMGLHRLFQEEGNLHLPADERADLVRDNTRRLYMAISRAGQRVILSHVGALPAALSQLLSETETAHLQAPASTSQ